MGTTFQKRQKEMKRLDKQRMKAERRAQKKQENRSANVSGSESANLETLDESAAPIGITGESHD